MVWRLRLRSERLPGILADAFTPLFGQASADDGMLAGADLSTESAFDVQSARRLPVTLAVAGLDHGSTHHRIVEASRVGEHR